MTGIIKVPDKNRYTFLFEIKLKIKLHSLFFFNDTATTEIYTLSLHDALPIYCVVAKEAGDDLPQPIPMQGTWLRRSEEHTSELQSRQYLVCRLLLETKKKKSGIEPSGSAVRVGRTHRLAQG